MVFLMIFRNCNQTEEDFAMPYYMCLYKGMLCTKLCCLEGQMHQRKTIYSNLLRAMAIFICASQH